MDVRWGRFVRRYPATHSSNRSRRILTGTKYLRFDSSAMCGVGNDAVDKFAAVSENDISCRTSRRRVADVASEDHM